ncbi:MAG: SufD family Fe-S cluster assembly protein [Lachnospiraceae bacterium]|nr:SufD family Fe-S cluster assembly protein [Lachnospiraceae bacterium]
MEVKLNKIPALTWNWLRMNEATVSDVPVLSEGTLLGQFPDEVRAERRPGAKLSFRTGMGTAVDEMIQKSGAEIVSVYSDQKVTEPVYLRFSYQGGAADANAFELHAEENSELTVVMHFSSDRKAGGNACVQTRYHVGKNAKITLIQIQTLGDEFTFYNDIGGEADENGSFCLIQMILGGKHTYLGSFSELSGRKSSLKADIAYRLAGTDTLDMNYVADHIGQKTRCGILASGVLRGSSQKLFRGTIDFHRGCAGAKGDESEDVLLMDDDVQNQTIPIILCDEEDVEGNHGATIGQLDENLMFYLQSRGIEEEAVREMMARARLDAVCAKIEDEKTREIVQAYLDEENQI